MATHPYLDVSGPIAFAHRGGAGVEPENSMQAFEHAHSLGYRYLETDAHLTADGVVVAFHDPTLDRVTDRVGAIADLAWSELASARIDGRGSIPSMAELLRRFPDARLNIDTKVDAVVGPLLALIDELDAYDRVCVGSFSDRRLRRARRLGGSRLCTSAGPVEIARHVARARRIRLPAGCAQILQVPTTVGRVEIVTRRFVERARLDAKAVHVWTINDPDEMHRLLDLGVDGIMTDLPEVLRSIMIARGVW